MIFEKINKKALVVLLISVIIIGVTLIINKVNPPEQARPAEDVNVETEQSMGSEEENVSNNDVDVSDIVIIEPRAIFQGVITDLDIEGSKGKIVLEIGEGEYKQEREFDTNLELLVFNANKDILVEPRSLIKGMKVTILAKLGVASTVNPTAEAVLLGDSVDLITVAEVDDYYLTSKDKDIKIALGVKEGDQLYVVNAFTGEPYDTSKIKRGDKVFFTIKKEYFSKEDILSVKEQVESLGLKIPSNYPAFKDESSSVGFNEVQIPDGVELTEEQKETLDDMKILPLDDVSDQRIIIPLKLSVYPVTIPE